LFKACGQANFFCAIDEIEVDGLECGVQVDVGLDPSSGKTKLSPAVQHVVDE
jgi:RecA/RadA recombinase